MNKLSFTLRQVLIASMLVFTVVPAALVGWLLYSSSRQSVEVLANKIITNVADRVQGDVEGHLDEAHIIFNSLIPERPNPEQVKAALRLMHEPQRFEDVAVAISRISANAPFWYFGSRHGEFFGVETDPNNPEDRLTVREQKKGEDRRRFYLAASAGDRSQPQAPEARPFEPRQRPWYLGALAASGRAFTPVYLSASKKKLIITLAQPVYEADGAALGVFAADVFLNQINELLQGQQISAQGNAYLLDDQGFLVASSAGDELFTEVGGKLERVKASASANPLIRQSYAAIAPWLDKTDPRAAQHDRLLSSIPLPDGDQLKTVLQPFGQRLGLHWSLVVTAPESDFAGETQRALRQAGWVMLAVVAGGALLAGLFAYRLGRRFHGLNQAAAQLGRGEVPPPQDQANIREVQVLARALHHSGQLLNDARADIENKAQALADANEHLEARVERRTAQLAASREEALQAAKAKAAFLATMSHEIRTPLNGVVGMTSLLNDTPLNDEQRDYLHTMRVSSDQLLGVINDILDFSKIESGKLDLESEPLNLQLAVEEACDIAAPRAREKGLELVADSGDGVPHWVRGDVTRLRQVLLNFINNAVKFAERGQVVVSTRVLQEFETGRASGEGALIEFRVKDSGIGIPPDRIGALFQSFTQVDASTTRKYGGTGLGLAICKRLAQLMGGDVGVESVLGQGSTFWFTARLGYADTPLLSETSQLQRSSLSGRSALVVDDTELNLRILNKQLGGWAMQVQSFSAPQDALVWLQTNTVDVVLTDMHMPGMDGMDFTRSLRQQLTERQSPQVPVLLLTSGVLPTGADAKLFDARMFKPYRQTQLFEALARALAAPGNAPRGSAAAGTAQQKNQSILVADDNAVNIKVALAMLAKLGYDAVVAKDGFEAVARMNEALGPQGQPFAAVLMDANMPGMDGYEASRIIIEQYAHLAPPIIALTASVLEEDRKRAQDAGMVGFLPKPLRIEELTQTLSQWALDKPQLIGAAALPAGAPAPATAPAQNSVMNVAPSNDSATAEQPVQMDWGRLAQFQEFDDEQLSMTRDLIALFMADLPQRLADLEAALATQDAAALARAAHALKGAASNVGALSVSDRSALLEQQARQGQVPIDSAAQLASIRAAGQATLAALSRWTPA